MQKKSRQAAVTSQKQKVEELARKFTTEARGGRQSERGRWDSLDHIIGILPMYKRRNGVKILQFGAMQARGRRQAAADANFPHFVMLLQEFMRVHGPIPVRHLE
eukprot:4650574-Amphidinium_carterae.1